MRRNPSLIARPPDSTQHGHPPPDPFDTVRAGRPAASSSAPRPPAFPIPGWERYQPLGFLGQGGMGRVFLARDPRLGRDVAVKFVRGDDPELKRRLVQEARAQAKVNHERVCKIFEAGEVDGNVYIVMQHIAGTPLGALAPSLDVDEKALLIRDAALGVHEAHRAGIIHRDIKPSNILVERAEDGTLLPYVMDFGLARSIPDGQTATDAVVGTPHYMAPEQARGHIRRLDCRADVYSLGATLYHLLAGEPPVGGENALSVLHNVASAEPRPLRAIQPDIPADLEAITMRCLEKDRADRYASARALAEDLDRFLQGEAVTVRSVGVFSRLRRRVARNRPLAAVVAAAAVAVTLAVSWGVTNQLESARRERAAQRFAEVAEQIEAMAHYSALAPLHDTGPDRRLMQAKLDELEAEIGRSGPLSAGSGHYALGRGALALGREEEALRHLTEAWQVGYREPKVAFALAVVLGGLYQERRLEAERLRDPAEREGRLRELERRYRDPALAYMEQSEGAEVPSSEYVAALVASYEGRLDDALHHLDAVGSGLPWSYDADKLRGDVLAARAARRWNSGDRAGALADFETGRRAYARAAAVGESAASVHRALGELEYAAMVMQLYGGGDVAPAFERGVAATGRALRAQPDHEASLVLDARFHRRMAEHRVNQGADAEDLLRKAIADAEAAVAAAPDKATPRLELGRSLWQRAQSESERGLDPRGALQQALAAFESVRPEDRDYDFHVNLGLVFEVWADYEEQIGVDPAAHRGQAIDAYRAATDLDERPTEGWLNLGNAYYLRAAHPRSKDPDEDLAKGVAALDRALAMNPNNSVACFYGGQTHKLLAWRQRARGGDARPELQRALALFRRGIAIDPKLSHLHNGAGTIQLELAREAWDRGEDPAPFLLAARGAYEEAVATAPEQPFGHHNVGEALAQSVSYAAAGGADPTAAAREAIPAVLRAVEKLPGSAAPRANLGMVYSILAAFEQEHGRDPARFVAKAKAALAAALELNPEDAQSHRYLGESRAVEARARAARGQRGSAGFEEAAQAFEKAIELAPDDQDHRLAFARFCRARAEREEDPDAALGRGLEIVEALLSVRPGWADARVVRASLKLLSARRGPAGERRARSEQAAADYAAALAANGNLEARWGREAALARRLADEPP